MTTEYIYTILTIAAVLFFAAGFIGLAVTLANLIIPADEWGD